MEIHPVTHLPPQTPNLEKEAVAEGFRFITRLTSEWHSGTNHFDAPGECLMAAYVEGQLVGIGGLSVDLFTQTPTGRLRRIYVTPASRGQQVADDWLTPCSPTPLCILKRCAFTPTLRREALFICPAASH